MNRKLNLPPNSHFQALQQKLKQIQLVHPTDRVKIHKIFPKMSLEVCKCKSFLIHGICRKYVTITIVLVSYRSPLKFIFAYREQKFSWSSSIPIYSLSSILIFLNGQHIWIYHKHMYISIEIPILLRRSTLYIFLET